MTRKWSNCRSASHRGRFLHLCGYQRPSPAALLPRVPILTYFDKMMILLTTNCFCTAVCATVSQFFTAPAAPAELVFGSTITSG